MPFIGREPEIADIVALLDDPGCRLLSLIGPGGMGKTRLALEVASRKQDDFADGVFFVALQSLASPEGIPAAVGEALGINFQSINADSQILGIDSTLAGDARQQLLNYLSNQQLLLLMDNFEHVVEGAHLVADILEYAPRIKILTTSREALNLQLEWVRHVSGMSFPENGHLGEIDRYSAVKLFIERATRTRGDFSLEHELPCVVEVCRLVEGMPLGIELAATWLKSLSCRDIAAEIRRSADILATTARDVPERHRSIRAVFLYSWMLLNETEQNTLMQLSIFRSGVSRDAIQAVTGASLFVLTALVEKSLITTSDGRYYMHDLLRQYAEEQLEQIGHSAART